MVFFKVFIVAMIFTVVASKKPIKTPKVRGHLGELFKMLIPPEQTLMFIYKNGNEDCIEAIKQANNPRFIINMDRPIERVLNMTYTYIIYTDSNIWLKKTLKELKYSILYYKSDGLRGRYFVISGRRDITKMAMVFLRYYITEVTFLQRQKEKTIFANQTLNELKARRICSPRYYTVKNNVIQFPHINKIILRFPRWLRHSEPRNQVRFHLMHESTCLMANALNAVCVVSRKCCPKKDVRCICLFAYYTNAFKSSNPQLEASFPFFIDEEVLFVPRVTKPKSIESVIFVFPWSMFAILLAIFVFFILFCWLLSRLLKEDIVLQRLGTWGLISTQYLLGFAISRLPRSNSLRILLIFYIFYSLQVSYVYQSNMTSVLTDPEDEAEIDTLRELSNTNIKLMLRGYQKRVLKEDVPDLYKILKSKILIAPSNMKDVELMSIAAKNNYAIGMGNEIFQYAYPQYAQKYYPLKYVRFLQTSIGFLAPKGHYFYDKLNFYLRQIVEGGFQRKILAEAKKKHEKKEEAEEVPPNIYLTFKHLKEVYIFWAVGMSIATAAFVCELLNFYVFRRIMEWLRRSDS